jgi:hypothetical protein
MLMLGAALAPSTRSRPALRRSPLHFQLSALKFDALRTVSGGKFWVCV